jgi:hypothetical protein
MDPRWWKSSKAVVSRGGAETLPAASMRQRYQIASTMVGAWPI